MEGGYGLHLNLKYWESTMHHKQALESMLKELMLAASALSLKPLCQLEELSGLLRVKKKMEPWMGHRITE